MYCIISTVGLMRELVDQFENDNKENFVLKITTNDHYDNFRVLESYCNDDFVGVDIDCEKIMHWLNGNEHDDVRSLFGVIDLCESAILYYLTDELVEISNRLVKQRSVKC